ncbi:MAG TPA: hypothetical protein VKZ95_07955 [Sphingobacteriaceae bacterium]|nr:hypothetical protein [Sphingobacteriaceae bacterium]
MIKVIIILIGLLASALCCAQQQAEVTLTLEQCLEIALENNLDLKRLILSKDASSITFKRSMHNPLKADTHSAAKRTVNPF